MSVQYFIKPEVDEFKVALTVLAQWVKLTLKESASMREVHTFFLALAAKIENGGIVELALFGQPLV